ncbi:DUF4835 family protein [soil metagenome]
MSIRSLRCQILIFCFFVVGTTDIWSQSKDLQVEVTVSAEALSADARDKLSDFKQKVESYLNTNKFHEKNLAPDWTVPVQMNFSFTSVSGLDNYNCKIIVQSQRKVYEPIKTGSPRLSPMFRILDERVAFSYNKSMSFIRNDQRFDPLVSLLDYYAYMILGYDEDSYFPKGGNKYFQKALDICNKPISDKNGWTETGGGSKPSRLQLVEEILSTKFDNFRKGYFEYEWMGIDSLAVIKRDAYRNILFALEKIDKVRKNEVRSFNIDIFYDTKYREISDTFLEYGDRAVYDKLAEYDPSHRNEYDDAKRRAR